MFQKATESNEDKTSGGGRREEEILESDKKHENKYN